MPVKLYFDKFGHGMNHQITIWRTPEYISWKQVKDQLMREFPRDFSDPHFKFVSAPNASNVEPLLNPAGVQVFEDFETMELDQTLEQGGFPDRGTFFYVQACAPPPPPPEEPEQATAPHVH